MTNNQQKKRKEELKKNFQKGIDNTQAIPYHVITLAIPPGFTGEAKMPRQITIELPDEITINGAKDAPESLRIVKTHKWEQDFIIAALSHAMSQKIGDPWGNKKNPKRGDAIRAVHESMEKGEWAVRERTGASAAKFDEGIKKLNAAALFNKLSPEQLSALAAMINADK